MDQRVYQIGISIINGFGPVKAKAVLKSIDNPETFFTDHLSSLKKIKEVNLSSFSNLDREKALNRAKHELDFIEKKGIQLHFFRDANFPYKLKQCFDAPIVLYSLGRVNFNQRNIAIVGTRKSTSYGKTMVAELVKDLSQYDVQIVSGLAHGIDKYAHESALENECSTLGVLGHGLDTMYPAAHRNLAKRMLDNGGLVTEFISGVVGDPGNFPKRNRIVAGLCEATVVVESSETGGSMITANLANDYNREVFAFPGNVDNDSSKGCNNLIKRQKAHLISDISDMVNVMGWEEAADKPVQQEIFIDLSKDEEMILNVVKEKGELDLDSLSITTEINAGDLSLHLFNLEMKGLIRSIPGQRYASV